MPVSSLERVATRVRRSIIEMSAAARAPHVASALSCTDILVALYFEVARVFSEDAEAADRDRIILSKGHASAALYACLAHRGFFSLSMLSDYIANNSVLGEHPVRATVPGIEASTGSLGHGLGVGSGLALAAKIDRQPWRVFVVLSDGECNEGSVWEAAMWAPAKGLSNLCAIIDCNGWQATARSAGIEPLAEKWRAFGWEVSEVSGHDFHDLVDALKGQKAKPHVIIARTVKGKGVSFMENDLEWHYRPPSADDVRRALAELEERCATHSSVP